MPSSASIAKTTIAQLGLRAPAILFEGDESPVPLIPESGPKFALPPPAPHVDTPIPTLPQSYGTHRLFLTARDPHCLYAHWDLEPEQPLASSHTRPAETLLLRIHSGDLAGPTVREVQVNREARHSFVQVNAADAQYVAELGLQSPSRDWTSLAASQPTRTPPDQIAETQVARFATFPLETSLPQASQPATPLPQHLSPVSVSTPSPARRKAPTALSPVELALVAPVVAAGAYPLPSLAAPEIPTPAPSDELSAEDLPIAPANEPASPSSNWTAAREAALAAVVGWVSIRSDRPDSAQLIELAHGASQPVPQEPAEVQPFVAPEEWPSGITSPSPQPALNQPEFWLRVNAELVVYGASAPDSNVSIGGRRIHLRPDGTFSYRFALPDGQYELPIVARSAQGEAREAKLTFQRATAFVGEVGTEAQTPGLTAPDPNVLT